MLVPLTKLLILSLLISLFVNGYTQAVTTPDDKYTRSEAMIPMRDGIKLHTVIFTPKQQTGSLPFIAMRTPYGAKFYPSPEKCRI